MQKDLRDGTALWVSGRLPTNTHSRQTVPRDHITLERVKEKLGKVIERKYVSPQEVVNVTSFFDVPKGEDDIRMVYDFTASKLNDALWAPNFWLPSIDNILGCATLSTWFGDVDAGEMFLNFPLDLKMRKYCGINISCVAGEKNKRTGHGYEAVAMGHHKTVVVDDGDH